MFQMTQHFSQCQMIVLFELNSGEFQKELLTTFLARRSVLYHNYVENDKNFDDCVYSNFDHTVRL